jgi:hypothetical protein
MILYFHKLLHIKLKDQHKASTPINNQKHGPNNWNNKDQHLGTSKGGRGDLPPLVLKTKLFFMIAFVAQDSITHNLLAVHTRIHFFQLCTNNQLPNNNGGVESKKCGERCALNAHMKI